MAGGMGTRLLPLTLVVPVEQAMAFMIALYCANHLAGGIPAILVKIPGSGGAAATTLDGYPMTQKGQAQQALVLCFTASVFGGLITTLATIALLPWLSQIGLYLRSVEMVVVMLFGLTLIAVIAGKDTLKALIGGFFGLLIGGIVSLIAPQSLDVDMRRERGPDHLTADEIDANPALVQELKQRLLAELE